MTLQTALRLTKSDNLIENQQNAEFLGNRTHPLDKIVPDRHNTRLWIENHTRQFIPVARQKPLDALFIVIGQNNHILKRVQRHTSRTGNRIGRRRFTRGFQRRGSADLHSIVTPVVTALELRDLRPAAETSRQPDRVQCGFGSGTDKTDALNRRYALAHHPRQPGLNTRCSAKRDAIDQLSLHRFYNRGMVMPQNLRGVVIREIDIGPAINIFEHTPLSPSQRNRIRRKKIGALGGASIHRPPVLKHLTGHRRQFAISNFNSLLRHCTISLTVSTGVSHFPQAPGASRNRQASQ